MFRIFIDPLIAPSRINMGILAVPSFKFNQIQTEVYYTGYLIDNIYIWEHFKVKHRYLLFFNKGEANDSRDLHSQTKLI